MPPVKRVFARKKVCRFCTTDQETIINYKDLKTIRYFISERAKIMPRRISGTCATHQRQLCEAIKKARQIALIPYTGIILK